MAHQSSTQSFCLLLRIRTLRNVLHNHHEVFVLPREILLSINTALEHSKNDKEVQRNGRKSKVKPLGKFLLDPGLKISVVML